MPTKAIKLNVCLRDNLFLHLIRVYFHISNSLHFQYFFFFNFNISTTSLLLSNCFVDAYNKLHQLESQIRLHVLCGHVLIETLQISQKGHQSLLLAGENISARCYLHVWGMSVKFVDTTDYKKTSISSHVLVFLVRMDNYYAHFVKLLKQLRNQ